MIIYKTIRCSRFTFILGKLFLPICIHLSIFLSTCWPEPYLMLFKPLVFASGDVILSLIVTGCFIYVLSTILSIIHTSDQVKSTFLPVIHFETQPSQYFQRNSFIMSHIFGSFSIRNIYTPLLNNIIIIYHRQIKLNLSTVA